MSPTPAAREEYYQEALDALQRALDRHADSSPAEKEALVDDFRQLQEMACKLRSGRVDIIAFGEINTGKSAVINALVGAKVARSTVIGGETRETRRWTWDGCGYQVPGFAESRVHLVDTPGINEVDGADRERMAAEAAHRADLILFVTDSDLNELEHIAFRELASTNRPILLVFNKSDLYSARDRQRLIEVFQERLPGIVGPEDIVEVAADPLEREYVIDLPDGTERIETRKPPPRIGPLKERILEVLDRDGKALVALNAALYAADATDRIVALRVRLRNDQANTAIWRYAVAKGIAVAVNPVPVADVLGGTAVDVTMVIHLGGIYGIEMSRAKALDLIKSIAVAAGFMTFAEWLTHLAATLFKGLTAGAGTLVTAVPQGGVGGYGSYIVGQAAKRYFEQGASWGPAGAKEVVSRILETTDKESVLARLKDDILDKLRRNKHAAGKH